MAPEKQRTVYVLYLVGFMDLLGVSMIIPLLSLHAKDIGASPAIIGILGSTYGLLQLLSSPIVGTWSDRAGQRLVLIYTLLLASTGYFMLASATSMYLLFLSRIPTGIFKHSQEVVVSYLSTSLPTSQRASVFGRFQAMSSVGFAVGPIMGGHLAELPGGFHLVALATTSIFVINAGLFKQTQSLLKVALANHIPKDLQAAAFGQFNAISTMGFVVGPVLGGHLSEIYGQRLVFYASAVLFVINAGIVWWFIPKDVPTESSPTEKSKSPKASGLQIGLFLKNIKGIDWDILWDIFLVRFLLGFASIVFRSNFSLSLRTQYDLSSKDIGYIISFNSIISTISGLFVGRVSSFYSNDKHLLIHMGLLQALSIGLSVIAPSTILLVLSLAPLSISNSVMRVCITNLTIQRAKSGETGAVLGCGASVLSVARMIAPMLGGFAMHVHESGASLLGVLSALAGVVLLGAVRNNSKNHEKLS